MQASRTHSLTIQSSMQRIKSNQSLQKPEQTNSFIPQQPAFKPSFSNARRNQRSYSYMNNKTVDENKSSLERILGANQASKLFDTLERILNTNHVMDFKPLNKIENSRSQMQFNQNQKISRNEKIMPSGTQTITKTIDLMKDSKQSDSKQNLHGFKKLSITNQSPRPPKSSCAHRREISSPDVQNLANKQSILKEEMMSQ